MSVLKIKDSNGVWIHIPTIKGEKGDSYILTAADKAEIAGLVETAVDDVQINGTSIVQNNIAKIPVAGENLGAVKIGATQGWYGLKTNNEGNIFIEKAASSTVKNGSESYQPIVPATQHEAAFYGLAKAAGHDEKSSTLPVGQYSDDAKAAIKTMLDVQDNMVVKVTGTGAIRSVDHTFAEIASALGSGINVIVDDTDAAQPYVGLVNINGAVSFAFGVSATYNGVSTLTGYLITDMGDGTVAIRVEQNTNIVSDVKVNGTSVVDGGVASISVTDGKDGKDGVDGVSPTAKVEAVTGGAKVTITDKNGTTTATLTNGQDGAPGAAGSPGAAGRDGEDGFSPSASVTQTASGATISITDKNGTTTANVTNGQDGQPGGKGDTGERGTGMLKVTTAPTSYTTQTGGFTPKFRIALSTVKTQSGVDEILVGDILIYSYNHYVVGYVDSDYVYVGAATSFRGAKGATGSAGAAGTSPTASVTQTSTGATISITDANGTTTADIANGAKGDPGDDYVLTAQDKSDIAEIVAENGLFYETHCNGQVFNVSNPGATWVNTDGTMNGLQVRRYVFDADGNQDVVQLSRVYDSSVEAYCYTGTSETLGITLTYYYSNTLINQSHIEFSNNVSEFKMYIYSSTALVELKTGHNIGQVFANKILSLIDDYYDNGDTSYYG